MRSNRLLLASFLALVLAGCGGPVSNGPTGRNVYQGGAIPYVGQDYVYRILPNASITGVIPGQNLGYFITANVGGSFRLVWTGDTSQGGRHLTGSVWTRGHFTNQVVGCNGSFCNPAVDNYISAIANAAGGGQRIDWDALSGRGIEGFDFVVDTVPAIFDVRIDGEPRADLIYFPATDAMPSGTVANCGAMPCGLIPE